MNIILASASPRRKELLKLIIDEFEVRPSHVDETLPTNISCENAAEFLACAKAECVKAADGEIVIGCDTVVVFENKILGKPKNYEDCRDMLSTLSGNAHFVYTGICIISGDKKYSFTEKTRVEFNSLTDEEIESYIATGEPFDKAGGYGIQGKGALLVKSIQGDYFNVVGLPISRLNRELTYFFEKK